ncbi:SDR family NAD(P)-dependent oxidoreductase [Actibacterium ureilyticum]|uniref:SDR family NAD(P)-dependent oxidoreductase n=1 Tax=Actibacterium ureilyticum TaxID=1590614 RepID=UPI000BAB18C4|nr:SDR family NAD(P)-dependent oxidoreductase [Actibacterium ureilyticum]
MSGKTILITGCSTGIGYDAAHSLKARGWRVFATCRQPADCDRLLDEGLESLVLDYEDPASIAAAVESVLDRTGGTLDALFNNGAYAIPAPLEDVPRDAMRAIFEANLIGWHDLTNQVIPAMRAQGHGRIINCSSVLGLVGMKWRGAYVATKFALEGMTDVLRQEMDGTGIRVSLIEPGPIATPFRKNAVAQFEKWIDWESSARADQYRESLLDQLYKGSSGPSWPASAVTAKLIHAVESPRPRARYFVTTPTHIANGLRRVLPTGLLDRALGRG